LYVCIFMGKSHVALKDLVHCQCVFMVKSHVALKDLIRSQCVFYGQISCFRQRSCMFPMCLYGQVTSKLLYTH
jgi:hypothetical protein